MDRMRIPTGLTRRCDRSERGAAMVEFAMILPLLVLLTFGIIEFGFAFNTSSDVSQSSRAGGRTAAIFSTDPQLEYNAAQAAATALNISPNSVKAGTDPIVCVSKFVAGSDPCTNQYSSGPIHLKKGASGSQVWNINITGTAGQIPPGNDNWPVENRNYGCPTAGQPNGAYDRVIVRVKVQHSLLVPGLFSQFFGNSTAPTITSDSIFQLEPVPTSTCP
jgi:Flp pilus assembly protein TadG